MRNLKMKLDNYCTLCTDQKNLQNNSTFAQIKKAYKKILQNLMRLFKDGGNFYENQK